MRRDFVVIYDSTLFDVMTENTGIQESHSLQNTNHACSPVICHNPRVIIPTSLLKSYFFISTEYAPISEEKTLTGLKLPLSQQTIIF